MKLLIILLLSSSVYAATIHERREDLGYRFEVLTSQRLCALDRANQALNAALGLARAEEYSKDLVLLCKKWARSVHFAYMRWKFADRHFRRLTNGYYFSR